MSVEYLVARNPRVKSLKRLMSSARERRETGLFVLEHVAAIAEALSADAAGDGPVPAVDALWVDEARANVHRDLIASAEAAGVRVMGLAEGVFASVSDTVNSAGVLATLPRPSTTLVETAGDRSGSAGHQGETVEVAPPFELVLVEVADPGNAGAMVRVGEGVGATRVVATAGSVDVFGPKTVRATTGSVMRVPIATDVSIDEVLSHYRTTGVATIATVAEGGVAPEELADAVACGPIALLIGSEAHGLPDAVTGQADHRLTIPLLGRVESLNAAVAAAVIGFEVARRRRSS